MGDETGVKYGAGLASRGESTKSLIEFFFFLMNGLYLGDNKEPSRSFK